MRRTLGTLLVAMLALQTFGQESVPTAADSVRKERQSPNAKPHQFRGRRMDQDEMFGKALGNPEVAERLGLSAAQSGAIRERMAQLQEQHLSLREQMEEAAMKQARLMMAKELDEAALMEAVEETGRLHTQQAKLRVQHLLFIRRILTPEQAQSLRGILRDHREARRDGSGWRERVGIEPN